MKFIRGFVPSSVFGWYHFLFALLSALRFWFPSRKLVVIGVTGTNGKSTTVDMVSRILSEAGFKVASTSSIRFQIGEKEWRNTFKMTMPGRFFFQKFLRQAVEAGCTYAVIEVTSEGILQHRHRFLNFHTAVFTNLSPEHIERHGGFENYKKTKGKLFQAAKQVHVINIDDEHAPYYLQFQAKEKHGYAIKSKIQISNSKINPKSKFSNLKTIEAENLTVSLEGIRFSIGNTQCNLKLLGEFNVYNALAAICVGLSQGISFEVCKRALEKMEGVPGRMELVIKEPFKVFVDYAFTPNALEKVYKTLVENWKLEIENSKLICVLGAAGGGRDTWKRPVLGEIAAKYCERIILTNEDPYEEDPQQILTQIKSGILNSQFPISNFYEILDRREAIAKALSLAKLRDVVIITGKGCEDSIAIAGGEKIPWDDREVVKEEFAKLSSLL